MTNDELTQKIIGAAIEVHRELGPGLLESVYEACLEYELNLLGLNVARQKPFDVQYKTMHFDLGFRMDLLVENRIVVENKALDVVPKIHWAKVISYLRLAGYKLALMINFNVPVLVDGIRRIELRPRPGERPPP